MKKVYTSFEELPLCLKAQDVADVMDISVPSAYEVINRDGFPSIKVGQSQTRYVIPRDRFRAWLLGITGYEFARLIWEIDVKDIRDKLAYIANENQMTETELVVEIIRQWLQENSAMCAGHLRAVK